MSASRRTIVSVHAHPDDEALLTAGTLARAVRRGERVVLVVATDGGSGLAVGGPGLGGRRLAELDASAEAIGAARVVHLGYADSGYDPRQATTASADAFSRRPLDDVAAAIAAVLDDEGADVVTGYDAAGGYGHPDHVQVHRAVRRAAVLAGTPRVLEATVPREPLAAAGRLLRAARHVVPSRVPDTPDLSSAFTPRARIDVRVDVRDHLDVKLACLRAHASQAGADDGGRTLGLLLALPRPLQRRVLGREWFVDATPGHARGSTVQP